MNSKKTGKFIAELRREQNMTQDDLAQKLYTDRSTVSKWERGVYVPKHDTILKLSNLFDVSVNELYYGERQNEENKKEINEIPINIEKTANKKMKRMLIVCVVIIVGFVLSFFTYYFINNYRSISVYRITGVGDNFQLYDGLMIVSRESSYIQLGNIRTSGGKTIQSVKLYYQKGDEEILIFEGENGLFMNHFSSYESFSYHDVKTVLANLYLEITYQENQKETIKLTSNREFVNKKLFYPKETPMAEGEANFAPKEIPKYIKDNFTLNEEEEKYDLETHTKDMKIHQTYYYNADLYIVEEIHDDYIEYFDYFEPDITYYDTKNGKLVSQYNMITKTCLTETCNQDKIDYFIDEYISLFEE